MPQVFKLEELPEESRAKAIASAQKKGIDPANALAVLHDDGRKEIVASPSPLRTAGVEFVSGMPAAGIGFLGGAGTRALLAARAGVRHPLALGIAALGGGMLSSMGGRLAQDKFLTPEALATEQAIGQKANPRSSFIGNLASGFLFGKPTRSGSTATSMLEALPNPVPQLRLSRFLNRFALPAGSQAGVDAGLQLNEQRQQRAADELQGLTPKPYTLDPLRTILSAATGLAQQNPTRAGQKLIDIGERLGAGPHAPFRAPNPQGTGRTPLVQEVEAKVTEVIRNGGTLDDAFSMLTPEEQAVTSMNYLKSLLPTRGVLDAGARDEMVNMVRSARLIPDYGGDQSRAMQAFIKEARRKSPIGHELTPEQLVQLWAQAGGKQANFTKLVGEALAAAEAEGLRIKSEGEQQRAQGVIDEVVGEKAANLETAERKAAAMPDRVGGVPLAKAAENLATPPTAGSAKHGEAVESYRAEEARTIGKEGSAFSKEEQAELQSLKADRDALAAVGIDPDADPGIKDRIARFQERRLGRAKAVQSEATVLWRGETEDGQILWGRTADEAGKDRPDIKNLRQATPEEITKWNEEKAAELKLNEEGDEGEAPPPEKPPTPEPPAPAPETPPAPEPPKRPSMEGTFSFGPKFSTRRETMRSEALPRFGIPETPRRATTLFTGANDIYGRPTDYAEGALPMGPADTDLAAAQSAGRRRASMERGDENATQVQRKAEVKPEVPTTTPPTRTPALLPAHAQTTHDETANRLLDTWKKVSGQEDWTLRMAELDDAGDTAGLLREVTDRIKDLKIARLEKTAQEGRLQATERQSANPLNREAGNPALSNRRLAREAAAAGTTIVGSEAPTNPAQPAAPEPAPNRPRTPMEARKELAELGVPEPLIDGMLIEGADPVRVADDYVKANKFSAGVAEKVRAGIVNVLKFTKRTAKPAAPAPAPARASMETPAAPEAPRTSAFQTEVDKILKARGESMTPEEAEAFVDAETPEQKAAFLKEFRKTVPKKRASMEGPSPKPEAPKETKGAKATKAPATETFDLNALHTLEELQAYYASLPKTKVALARRQDVLRKIAEVKKAQKAPEPPKEQPSDFEGIAKLLGYESSKQMKEDTSSTTDVVSSAPYKKRASVKPSKIEGDGLFAEEHNAAKKNLFPVQIGKNRTEFGSKLNHSDKPNAEVVEKGGDLWLRTLVEVPKGTELTIDYIAANALRRGYLAKQGIEIPLGNVKPPTLGSKIHQYFKTAKEDGFAIPFKDEQEAVSAMLAIKQHMGDSMDVDVRRTGLTIAQLKFLRSAGLIHGNIEALPYRVALVDSIETASGEGIGIRPAPILEQSTLGAPFRLIRKKAIDPIWGRFRSITQKIAAFDIPEVAKNRILNANREIQQQFNAYSNRFGERVREAMKVTGLSKDSMERIHQYYDDMDTERGGLGVSPIKLTPAEEFVARLLRSMYVEVRSEQNDLGMDIAGRQAGFNDNYLNHSMSQDTWKTLRTKGENDPAFQRLRRDFIDREMERGGLSEDEAAQLFNEFLPNPQKSTTRRRISEDEDAFNSFFGPLQKAQNRVGLPMSWRPHDLNSHLRYARRAALALADWKVTGNRNDPEALAVSQMLYGDNPDMEFFDAETRQMTKLPHIARLEPIENMLRSWEAMKGGPSGTLDKLNSLASAGFVQTPAKIRDLLGTPAAASEILPLERAMTHLSEVLQRAKGAVKSGAVPAHRVSDFFADRDLTDLPTQAASAVRTLTGNEVIERGSRAFAYGLGHWSADYWLDNGMEKELTKLIGNAGWKYLKNREAVRQAAGWAAVQRTQGMYGNEGLPEYFFGSVDKGQAAAAMRFMAQYTRFAVERSNNWLDTVWKPAEQGNLKPLLKSMGYNILLGAGFNEFMNMLLKKKPADMTWKEFVNSGRTDAWRWALNQATGIGWAGMFGWTLNAVLNANRNPNVRTPESPLVTMSGYIVARLLQANASRTSDGREFMDLVTEVPKALLQDWSQNMKAIKYKDSGKRDERLWNVSKGRVSYNPFTINNPFTASAVLKDESTTPEKASRVVRGYVEKNRKLPEMRSTIRPLDYYQFVSRLRGEEEGRAAYSRDLQEEQRRRQVLFRATAR